MIQSGFIRKYRGLLVSLGLIGLVALAWPALTHAQATTFSVESIGSQIGLGDADLRRTIINVIRVILGLVTLAAVAYLIYGGFLWLTSRGNAQQVEKAKRVILQATIGLVIIILAWAIVQFVARTLSNVTGNGGNGGTPPGGCGPSNPFCIGAQSDFNVIGITSCAQRPEYDQNVPRSSNIAITFNNRVQVATVQTAVADSNATNPNLIVEKCDDPPDCSTGTCIPVAGCSNWSTPHPIDGQVFTPSTPGPAPAGAAGATKAEWVVNRNTITFYHKSFSDDPLDLANNRWFEENTTYRVSIPKNTAVTALKDLRNRALKRCESAPLTPIEGGGCDDTRDDVMYWTFATGADTNGPALEVRNTTPTSAYRSGSGFPDRNVTRKPIIGIDFNNAIDPNSLSTDNFQIFKLDAAPNVADRPSWQVGTQVPPAQLDFDYSSTGAWMTLIDDNLLEPFTWYMVTVKDVRNLCGTLQLENPYEWVFQTNDAVPGVKLVYPTSDKVCPSSEVFIKFATPMWKPGSLDCQANAAGIGTYVLSGTLSPNPGRTFGVVNNFDPDNANGSCTKYAWTTTDQLLAPNRDHTANVTTDLVIDQAGTQLTKSWSFHTATADACIQEPYIDRISPTSGPSGACVSVIGNYFEKKLPGTSTPESDGQNPGDVLQLGNLDQTNIGTWTNRNIVSEVRSTDGAAITLAPGPHKYKVTVAYPTLGNLPSNEETFYLEPGTGGDGPCLLSVNPDRGPAGVGADFRGKNLGAGGGSSAVPYTNGSTTNWDISRASWSPTNIDSVQVTLPSPVGDGSVRVIRDDGRVSNDLAFTVTAPINSETAPRVVEDTLCDTDLNIIPSPNPKRNDTQACINTQVTARFTIPMYGPSIENAGAIRLERCDPTCTLVPSNTVFLPDRAFALSPSPAGTTLAPGTQYRVTVTTAVESALRQAMAVPYSWNFTTTTGANCPVANLACSSGVVQGTAVQSTPTSYTFRVSPYGVGLNALALGPECRTIDNSSVNFSWSMNPDPNQVITLGASSGSSNVALNVDPPTPGSAKVKATAQSKSCKETAVIFDPTICNTNADCATNRFGEACTGSTCEANRCTPIVSGIEAGQCSGAPTAQGPIGSWLTVKGCWFGGFDTVKSRVIFRGDPSDPNDDHDGRAPDALVCGSPAGTWTNERIVREVPNTVTLETTDDAGTGPIRVNRSDDQFADGPVYTVNADPLPPGVCKVSPSQVFPIETTTVSGARFGATQDAGDEVTLQKIGSATVVPMTILGSTWSDTSIGTQVPPTAEVGGNEVRVKNAACTSNPWPFVVKDPTDTSAACTTKICAVDSNCAPEFNTADYGCARDFCCRPRPKLQSGSPTGNNVCRNTVVTATFDQPLDGSSATPDTLRYLDGIQAVTGAISVSNTATTGTIFYQPGLLSPNTAQRLHLTTASGGTTLKGKNGVLANVTSSPTISPIGFQTGPDICKIKRVVVNPSFYRFTALNQDNTSYYAFAEGPSGEVLNNIPGVYAWRWNWASRNAAVAAVNAPPATSSLGPATVSSRGNGSTVVTATATVTEDASGGGVPKEFSGDGQVAVEVCDVPWMIGAAVGYTDSDYHFSLYYCRGQFGQTPLPNFGYTAIEGDRGDGSGRVKSIFFKEKATTRDVIGMLIYRNDSFLSPADWYQDQFSNTGASSTVIAGYPAVKTGTTTYIGVTDLDGASLRGLIFVIDFNSNNATAETKNIYNRILSTLTFNTNISNPTTKQQLVNDTKRRQDLTSIKLTMDAYKQANGTYPTLTGGSFLLGMSTSTWPSWQQTLGNATGKSMPSDPINGFTPACEPPTVPAGQGYDKNTCWSEPQRKFQCPGSSHIYAYRSNTAGTSISLYANMEYLGPGSFANRDPNSNMCGDLNGSQCSCFNYLLP